MMASMLSHIDVAVDDRDRTVIVHCTCSLCGSTFEEMLFRPFRIETRDGFDDMVERMGTPPRTLRESFWFAWLERHDGCRSSGSADERAG